MLKLPAVVVNFKTYKNSTGANAIKLAKALDFPNTAIVAQTADIGWLSCETNLPLLAQHIDNAEQGQSTGYVTAESVREEGAIGTLLNHSEHKLSFKVLRKSIEKAHKAGLFVVACAATPAEAKKIAKLKPDVIAIEPPELIGGKISISTAKPEIITRTTKAIRNIPILCGAGVHNAEDVRIALKLGAKGVLVASAVCLAKNPRKVLSELLKGLR